jgi:hypothetical protein
MSFSISLPCSLFPPTLRKSATALRYSRHSDAFSGAPSIAAANVTTVSTSASSIGSIRPNARRAAIMVAAAPVLFNLRLLVNLNPFWFVSK